MMKNKGIFITLAVLSALLLIGLFSTVLIMTVYDREGLDLSYGKAIGLVEISGPIISSDEAVRVIKKYRDNSSIKALVVRVDSPGGGVSASQEIFQAILSARDRKPVVCSMGETAASGGYYVACACDSIVANPGTLTGSIGVILSYVVMEELFKKIGIGYEVVKAGEVKDVGSPFRQMTPKERTMLQATINDIHLQFMEAVAEGREMPLDSVRLIADGRLLSGRQAWEAGLVDRLGTMEDAVEMAGLMAGIGGSPRVIRERKRRPSVFDLLAESSEAISNLKNNSRAKLEYRLGR